MRPPILCPLLSCLESVTSLPSCPTATHRGRGASAAWTLPVESRSVRAMRPDLQAPQTWSGARHRSEIDHAALAFSGDFLPVRGLHPQHHHSRHASAAIEHWFVRVFAWHEQLVVPALLLHSGAERKSERSCAARINRLCVRGQS
jgi:hypothetical protein